jgi:tripartite-type tricarboxylate transporter receptor subunit TctC
MSHLRMMAAALAVVSAVQTTASAHDWPNRPVRFVVCFPAGGSTDVAARILGEYVTRSLGQQIYVENRGGANGNIGIEAAAKSAPDGYTFLVCTDSTTSNPHIYNMSVDVLKDLVPISRVSRQPIAMAAHPALSVKSLAELLTLARQQPGIRYATGGGPGTPQHMVAQWFAKIAGIKLEQVSYRGGGPAISDLIAGHVKLGFLGSTPLIPHYKAGTLYLLAQSMEARSASLPDVPTFQEVGMKALVLDQWIGVFAPVGTPPTITARLGATIGDALVDATVRERLLAAGQEPTPGTMEDFTRFVHEEFGKYQRLVHELDIKLN